MGRGQTCSITSSCSTIRSVGTVTQVTYLRRNTNQRLKNGSPVSKKSVAIHMSAADEFHDKTTAPNQLWQTDFTYLKVIGWGWLYLSTVLDDFSRYVIAWRLCTTMKASDVTATLEDALAASGLNQAEVRHRPRLLSDNGSSYIAHDLAQWMSDNAMTHIRGAPYHPMTQGKIERWHQTMKNRILLEHYY